MRQNDRTTTTDVACQLICHALAKFPSRWRISPAASRTINARRGGRSRLNSSRILSCDFPSVSVTCVPARADRQFVRSRNIASRLWKRDEKSRFPSIYERQRCASENRQNARIFAREHAVGCRFAPDRPSGVTALFRMCVCVCMRERESTEALPFSILDPLSIGTSR